MSSVNLAPTGQYYTFIPLMAILILTACKELLEDYVRCVRPTLSRPPTHTMRRRLT